MVGAILSPVSSGAEFWVPPELLLEELLPEELPDELPELPEPLELPEGGGLALPPEPPPPQAASDVVNNAASRSLYWNLPVIGFHMVSPRENVQILVIWFLYIETAYECSIIVQFDGLCNQLALG